MILPDFKNWRHFRGEWNKIYQNYVTEYPILLLDFDHQTVEERELSLRVRPMMLKAQNALRKRLPKDIKRPDIIKIKRRVGRILVPFEHAITDRFLSGAEDNSEYLLYDGFRETIVKKTCLSCGKYEFYRSMYPQSVIDFLEIRDPSYNVKFKYRDYCSDECKRKSHNLRRRKFKSIRQCPYCKEEYEGYGRTCGKHRCKKRAYRKKVNARPDASGLPETSGTSPLPSAQW